MNAQAPSAAEGRNRLREVLDRHTLPPNHILSSLPPLPQTPHHSRNAYFERDSDDQEAKYEPRSQRRRGLEREYPMSAAKRYGENARLDDTASVPTARLPRSTTLPSLSSESSPKRERPHFETTYPTLSTRQSSLNTARNTSPAKHDLLSPVRQSSALLHPSSAAKPSAESPFKSRRDVSASFMMPQGGDMSMLQDVTFGELGRVSLGNDTMNRDFGVLRGKSAAPETIKAGSRDEGADRYGDIGSVRGRPAPTPARQRPVSLKPSPRPPSDDYTHPTLPPSIPSKGPSSSTHRIAREEPSWLLSDTVAPVNPSRSPRPPTDSVRRTDSVRKARLPPSTSSNFLAVPAQDHAGDTSTPLPISPLKTRHLLSDEYLLTQTKMEDETMMSMSLIMPPISPEKPRSHRVVEDPLGHAHASPAKTPRTARNRMKADMADMTMDIQQMMARVKPTGVAGAEESVLDLFRTDVEDDDANASMMSDHFIPLDLRPGLVRSKSLSRLELEKRAGNTAQPAAFASPTRTLPRVRPTSYIASKAPVPLSPTKVQPIMPVVPFAATSRRVSLSVGAVPLPSSASLRKLELPTRRMVSPSKATLPSTSSTSRPAPTVPRAPASAVPRTAAKSSMPPPAPAGRAPQASKSRIGSTASIASTTRTSTLPRATSIRSLSKPSPAEVIPARAASSRPAVRLAAPPQPGTGLSARAGASAAPRSFGGDAAGLSNRLPRAAPTASARPTKGSMGPPFTVIPRSTAIPTAAKSRTLSTPATSISRAPPSARLPTSTTSARAPVSRSSAIPSDRPAPSGTASISRVPAQSSSGLARPHVTPAPISSAHQTGTIGRTSSKSAAAAGLADIRARLDRLQARHQISRPAR